MFPVAFSFGDSFPLQTYGLLIAFAFGIGLYLVAREAPRVGITVAQVADFGFWALVSALVGSRLMFLIVNWHVYYDACFETTPRDCLLALQFWRGGLVFYGGFIGAVATSIWFARSQRIPFLRLADAAAPSIALGHVFGRLGCFAAGCCYGKPGAHLLGVAFPSQSLAWNDWVLTGRIDAASHATPPLHPTQLYEAFGELAIFFALLAVRSRKRFHGQTLLGYLMLYPLLRTVVEVFRADALRGYVVEVPWPAVSRVLGLPLADPVLLSTSQLVSVAMAIAAATLYLRVGRRPATGA